MKSILVLIIIIVIISHLGPTVIARPNNNFTNVILKSDEVTTVSDDRVFVTVTQKNGFETTFENRGLMSENKLADDDKIIKEPYRKSENDITNNENDKLSVIDIDHTIGNNNDHGMNVNNKTVSSTVLQSIPIIEFHFEAVKTPFVIGIWILSASIAKIGFHKTPNLHKIFPESCLLIVIGVIIGFVLMFALPIEVSPLTPTTFFFYMLPPIILDAGYFMPNRLFFDNLGTILLMAVVGTIFNIATIGFSLWACGLLGIYGENPPILHTFVFASLISAVDPVAVLAVFEEIHVNEILYIVVFGESLLNDAVTVVLYHMCESYTQISVENIDLTHLVSGPTKFFVVALGGTFIGVIWGFLTGFITRFTDNVRVIEPIFIFVMAYLAYLNAELFGMSGIMAITFCGISMKNYVESNISQKSHTTIKYALKMLSSSSETVIFMFLGVATVNSSHDWNSCFVVATIVFCTIYRGIGVIILTALANKFRLHKLSNVDQFVMSYGGLRGAVAFALVLLIDKNKIGAQPMFVTTTIAVIYFTVFLQGITIKPLVKFLNVERANKKKPTMNERIHERFIDHLMAGIEDIVGKTGNYNVRDKFKRFDNKFIRPALIRDLKKGAEPKILETYSKLAMKDAMDYMRRNPSTIGQMSGTESMSALFRNYTTTLGGRLATTITEPIQCPSFSNLENCSRNLDMQELDYNPSKKDLTDARIHHLLAEELKPYKRHRRLSYSRHAVDDRDLTTQQVNYKMHMNIRRMNDRKHHKRSKRGSSKESGLKQNHVSFPEMKQNGSTKQLSHDYINEVLNETQDEDNKQTTVPNDDWDDGLTFTAKTSPESDCANYNNNLNINHNNMNNNNNNINASNTNNNNNNNSLITHIISLPGFDSSKARFVKQYSTMTKSHSDKFSLEIVPTAAELMLPWRNDIMYQAIGNEKNDTNEIIDSPHSSNDSNDKEKRLSKDSESETRVTTPTAIETQLPWKRDDGDDGDSGGAIKQNEFPAWASNKEYLAYNSPSATFLGGLTKPRQVMSVIGLFRRESSGSGSGLCMSEAGSDPMLAQHLTSEMGGGVGGVSGATSGIKRTPLSAVVASNIVAGNRPHDRRSASVCGVSPIFEINERNTEMDNTNSIGIELQGHSSPFAVTASHRRNVRRSSLLELNGQNKGHYFNLKSRPSDTIPEEIYSSSFPERNRGQNSSSPKPYKEPLLPLSDGSDNNNKAQIIQQTTNNNPQMKSLLISNEDDNSEANEEDIEELGDDDKKQHKHYRQRPDDTDI